MTKDYVLWRNRQTGQVLSSREAPGAEYLWERHDGDVESKPRRFRLKGAVTPYCYEISDGKLWWISVASGKIQQIQTVDSFLATGVWEEEPGEQPRRFRNKAGDCVCEIVGNRLWVVKPNGDRNLQRETVEDFLKHVGKYWVEIPAAPAVAEQPSKPEVPPDWKANYEDEKRRRVYYQDIVYAVCRTLDRRKRKEQTTVCGTVNSPTTEVQDAVENLLNEYAALNRRIDGDFGEAPIAPQIGAVGRDDDWALRRGENNPLPSGTKIILEAVKPKQPRGYGDGTPFVRILADATDHLLRVHDCDQDGYEVWMAALHHAKKYLGEESVTEQPRKRTGTVGRDRIKVTLNDSGVWCDDAHQAYHAHAVTQDCSAVQQSHNRTGVANLGGTRLPVTMNDNGKWELPGGQATVADFTVTEDPAVPVGAEPSEWKSPKEMHDKQMQRAEKAERELASAQKQLHEKPEEIIRRMGMTIGRRDEQLANAVARGVKAESELAKAQADAESMRQRCDDEERSRKSAYIFESKAMGERDEARADAENMRAAIDLLPDEGWPDDQFVTDACRRCRAAAQPGAGKPKPQEPK